MKTLVALFPLLVVAGFAQAHIHVYQATLSGGNEDIPNLSGATGTSTVTLDLDELNMLVDIEFSGLSASTTGAFIHGPTIIPLTGTAGPMSPALSDSGFLLGVTSGAYSHLFDLVSASSYNSAFVTAVGATPESLINAFNGLTAAFEDGEAYLSIESSAFPNGEIRGFYTEVVPVPEPASLSLIGATSCGLFSLSRRCR